MAGSFHFFHDTRGHRGLGWQRWMTGDLGLGFPAGISGNVGTTRGGRFGGACMCPWQVPPDHPAYPTCALSLGRGTWAHTVRKHLYRRQAVPDTPHSWRAQAKRYP